MFGCLFGGIGISNLCLLIANSHANVAALTVSIMVSYLKVDFLFNVNFIIFTDHHASISIRICILVIKNKINLTI